MSSAIRQQRDFSVSFDNLSIEELRRRGTVKWTLFGKDVLPAWVAEMDFPLAPVLQRALIEAVEQSCTGYPSVQEDRGLPVAWSSWLSRNFEVRVEPGHIKVLPDILRGIELAIEVYSPPDSPVAVTTPSYPPFFETVRAAGRKIVETPMTRSGDRFVFDLDAVEAAFVAGARTLVLCNPYNPLGRVFSREELAGLAAVVEAHGARVIADEVHAPLVYPGNKHVSYSTVSDAAPHHSVTLVSASKGWNLAGLKCAAIVLTCDADREAWETLSFVKTHGAGILGILANEVALNEGEPWLDEAVAYLDGNRRLLADLVGDHLPGVEYSIPEATYLAWLDCRQLQPDEPARFFLDNAGVALTDGVAFGPEGRGYVRLNFATSRAILTEIVEKMGAALRA